MGTSNNFYCSSYLNYFGKYEYKELFTWFAYLYLFRIRRIIDTRNVTHSNYLKSMQFLYLSFVLNTTLYYWLLFLAFTNSSVKIRRIDGLKIKWTIAVCIFQSKDVVLYISIFMLLDVSLHAKPLFNNVKHPETHDWTVAIPT